MWDLLEGYLLGGIIADLIGIIIILALIYFFLTVLLPYVIFAAVIYAVVKVIVYCSKNKENE